MNAANQRQLTPVLIVIAVLLGAGLLLLLGGVGRSVTWGAPRALAPLPPTGNPADVPQPLPLQQFALVWQKPLFSPDRKPVARAATGGSNLGDLELTGIILTTHLRMALLHNKSGDSQVRLHEGESLPDGSVKLVEIRPRSALFDSSAGRTELKLPAGAPIDPLKGDALDAAGGQPMRTDADGTGAPKADDSAGRPMMTPVQPAPAATPTQSPLGQTSESAVERLRKNIQKRRAARAAAANEGVR